jgi:ADP-heptose:LPS heptosyltransferase
MRLLFITSTRIGDAVLSTGLLAHLIATHRDLRVTVACGPAAAPLFEAVPGLDDLIVLAKKPLAGHWLELIRRTIGTFWDLIVDIRGSGASMLLARGTRYGWTSDRSAEHRVVQLARLLDLDPPPLPTLWTAPVHDDEAEHLMAGSGPVLALGPTANWSGKEWPVENFVDLAQRLTGPDAPLVGARILLSGAPSEAGRAQPLFEAFAPERIVDLFAPVPLLTAYACFRRADLFIGNDSGLMHMAAAAGIPTLGLFGPTDDRHYAPYGPRCAVVRTPQSYEELFPPGLDVRNTPSLMTGLTVDTVEAAARARLAGGRGPGKA